MSHGTPLTTAALAAYDQKRASIDAALNQLITSHQAAIDAGIERPVLVASFAIWLQKNGKPRITADLLAIAVDRLAKEQAS